MRHARPELSEGSQRLVCSASPGVLCVLRQKGQERTLLMVNLGTDSARPVMAPDAGGSMDWSDLLHGGNASPANIVLRPLQVVLLGTR